LSHIKHFVLSVEWAIEHPNGAFLHVLSEASKNYDFMHFTHLLLFKGFLATHPDLSLMQFNAPFLGSFKLYPSWSA
jgi:hypothetical protein